VDNFFKIKNINKYCGKEYIKLFFHRILMVINMKIRLGYVAISKALEFTTSRNLTYTNYLKNDPDNNLKNIDQKIKQNLNDLEQLIIYNIRNNFHFYRLTSKLIPLATKEEVKFDYIDKYQNYYARIGKLISKNKIRIDTHPDQYCVLNSVDKKIVDNSIEMLKYHKEILKALKINVPIIILHVGSNVFGKQNSITRFKNNFNKLEKELQQMIVIENDDKVFDIIDVLSLCDDLKIPMVLDYHHHICNNKEIDISKYIEKIFNTWNDKKERPKIHFSSPKSKLKKEFRSHHDYINVNDFIEFIEKIKFLDRDFDIMIEAKMKDEAVCRLVRQLKYKTKYKFIDETTFEV